MSILGEQIECLISEATARERAMTRNGGIAKRTYDGPRPDAIANDALPTIRLSDPRAGTPRHERGCLVGPDDDRYVCFTHGLELAWVRP